MEEKLLNAIIFCDPPDQVSGNTALKYRKIGNNQKSITSFLEFARKFPSAQYVNFYYRESRMFKERIYLQ